MSKLVNLKSIDVSDREQVFQYLLSIEAEEQSSQAHLSFLDRGSEQPPEATQLQQYPQRLQQAPHLAKAGAGFAPYSDYGEVPLVDETQGLTFLHPDIKAACLCVADVSNGQLQTRWMGRNALENRQCWSSTKIVPILHVLCRANQATINQPIQQCIIRDAQGRMPDLSFVETAIDIISYRNGAGDSNQKAGMLKRLSSLEELEDWFCDVTGAADLQFRGYYGGFPHISHPELRSPTDRLLAPAAEGEQGNNLVSAYALTRLMSLVGWHLHLDSDSRLPGAQWASLSAVVQALGQDTARFVDVAIDLLGVRDRIQSPVILSKLGFGTSSVRQRTEMIYTAFVQFEDARSADQPPVVRSFAFTLAGAMQKLDAAGNARDLDEEARCLDARMAAEVTELLRRVLAEEWV